jgi:hypothetical protein
MTSAYAAESNRRNALKSTGPRSPEGKQRSRCNALTHGATARLLALPGEDREDLDKQRNAWIDSSLTDDPIERAILERAFEAWHQLGRTLRAQQGRVEQQMREAELMERRKACDTAIELGDRLFCDSNGPYQCYPNRQPRSPTTLTSGNDIPGDPDLPARIVLRLESTAAGCRWLLARWNELAEMLADGECWRAPDRFRAIRLLGKQPLDALVDRDVRRIFLACHVLRPESKSPFDDLRREVGEQPGDRRSVLRTPLKQLPIEPYSPKDPEEASNFLASLVDRATSQLHVLLAEHEARDEEQSASAADRHAFDLEHDGELMRRYEASCDRSFHRALAQLRLLRKDAQSPVRGMPKGVGEAERGRGLILVAERDEETHEHPLAESTLLGAARTLSEIAPDAMAALEPESPDDDLESVTLNGPRLRNEPVAASIDCDDSATAIGNHTEPGPAEGEELRNEPVAASIDRDDSAGRAVSHSAAVRTRKPPDRPRRRTPRQAMLFANKQRVAGRSAGSALAPGTEPLRAILEALSPK